MKDKIKKDLIDNFWLRLGDVSKIHTENPVMLDQDLYRENPALFWVKYMANPDNFGFTCKHILNIELLPFQIKVIQQLWNHNFPMLIATRGGGKCITEDSLIQTNKGCVKIGDIVGQDSKEHTKILYDDLYVLNEFGKYNKVEYAWNNGYSEVVRIKTRCGYELSGTLNHPIRVADNGDIVWKEISTLNVGNYVPISRNTNWIQEENSLPQDLAYWFGLIVGDGGYTVRGRIGFTSKDKQLHKSFSSIAKKYFGLETKNSSEDITKIIYSTKLWDRLFNEFDFNSPVCGLKDIPKIIYSSSKESISAFISGLFDTDGGVNRDTGKIEYSSKSECLIKNLQLLLLKFGIVSRRKKRLNKKYKRYYHYLTISGNNIDIFKSQIGFKLKRKSKLLINKKRNTNIDIIPNSLVKCLDKNRTNYTYHSLPEKYKQLDWFKEHYFFDEIVSIEKGFDKTFDLHCEGNDHSFISNGFVSHNTFLLAIFSILKALFVPNSKVVIAGAAFRQSKYVFEYCETIYNNAPILKNILSSKANNRPRRDIDRCVFRMDTSKITALPIGDGKKIRGERATDLILEEFSSVNPLICEQVLVGFASVSANPIANVKEMARLEAYKELGYLDEYNAELEKSKIRSNKVIICGTPDFEFGHFCKYWKKYREIIYSKGNEDKLKEVFDGNIPPGTDYKDYCVIRIPYEEIPKGFMDNKTIGRAKATMHKSIFDMEYRALFVKDTEGFYKRSLIEKNVCKPGNIISYPSCGDAYFEPVIKGRIDKKYIMAIDPASELDNFSIVILEIWPEHRRVVYCWTTTKSRHRAQLRAGYTSEHDFYRHCCKKIRNLYKLFPCEYIGLDPGGGGISIEEGLGDPATLVLGELPFFPIIEEGKEKFTDDLKGHHIIVKAQFSKSDWLSDANHGMKKDLEDGILIFPATNDVVAALALEEDIRSHRLKADEDNDLVDTLEDCLLEIEDLKYELTTIVYSKTLNGRERWDTPEVKTEETTKKGRMVKDRYSALLIANKIARDYYKEQKFDRSGEYNFNFGGNARAILGVEKQRKVEKLYVGPDWFEQQMKNTIYGKSISRK